MSKNFLSTQLPLSVAVLVVCLPLLSGCGSGNPYKTVKVSGTIRYDDGSVIPADRIELKFVSLAAPIDEKTKPKLGIVEVDVSDGSFTEISTYEYGDGIVQGEHKVLAMSMDGRSHITEHIPAEYQSHETTPLMIDTANKTVELIVPKP